MAWGALTTCQCQRQPSPPPQKQHTPTHTPTHTQGRNQGGECWAECPQRQQGRFKVTDERRAEPSPRTDGHMCIVHLYYGARKICAVHATSFSDKTTWERSEHNLCEVVSKKEVKQISGFLAKEAKLCSFLFGLVYLLRLSASVGFASPRLKRCPAVSGGASGNQGL